MTSTTGMSFTGAVLSAGQLASKTCGKSVYMPNIADNTKPFRIMTDTNATDPYTQNHLKIVPTHFNTYDTFPGAILATLAMVAVSYVFSAFIGASVKYPMVYGSLASLILLMMWLYFCSLVIYCGAAFNIVLRDMKREKNLCFT